MNTLKLDIKEIEIDRTKELFISLFVDETEVFEPNSKLTNAIVFEELEESTISDGHFLIFTCSCGVADCAGWEKVKVKHDNRETAWTLEFEGSQYNFKFDKVQYVDEIKAMRNRINEEFLKLQPEVVIFPEED